MTDKSNASETNDKDAVPAAVTPEKGAAGKTGAEASADSEGKKGETRDFWQEKSERKVFLRGRFHPVVAAVSGGGQWCRWLLFFWQQSLGQKQQLATVDAEVDRQQQQIVQLQKKLAKGPAGIGATAATGQW